MKLKRLFKHLWTIRYHLNAAFPSSALAEIEAKITESETQHSGEIRFAVETSLDGSALLRDQSPRERAVELFSNLRVWDTEENCGLLIYVLLADRAVEIVADRGIHVKVGELEWNRICREMESEFSRGNYQEGLLAGIEQMTLHLKTHFPVQMNDRDELPNQPVQL
jgi:uncharacterized membrane protein YgcG